MTKTPAHYDHGTIEPIDFIHGHEMSFAAGCIVKYLVRYRYKEGVNDLRKARRYLDILIEEQSTEADNFMEDE